MWAHLERLQELGYIFPNGAGALGRDGVVALCQRQPVRDHHVDIYEL